jgi:hypothetical protein
VLMSVPQANQHKKQKAGTRKARELKQDSADRSCHFTDPNRKIDRERLSRILC